MNLKNREMLDKRLLILLISFLPWSLFNNSSNLFIGAFGSFQIKTYWEGRDIQTEVNRNGHIKIITTCTQLRGSKWDNLVDEDEEFEAQGPEVARDMRYVEFNIMRQNKHFVAIRETGGAIMTNDVYARDPGTDIYWFCGKVARISDVSLERAVARQYALVEEHSCRLRPLELYKKRGSIELWTAPGDSEMGVAYNRPNIQFVKMKRCNEVDGAEAVRNIEIGFQGEMYDSDEEGFRTCRTEDGLPMKPEIKQPEGEKRAPTDEEMVKISEMLQGQDLNELFTDEK